MKKPQNPKFSLALSDACSMMDNAAKDYTWNKEQIAKMDKLTQDYLHMLELNELDYKERAKIATKLRACRRERREHKDTVEVLEPLVQYLDSDKGKQLYNLLREALGKTRKAEERMGTRIYFPRVLVNEKIGAKK